MSEHGAAAGSGRDAKLARRRTVAGSAALLLTAADTYVVVPALPSIMADLDIDIQQIQRATPVVSGFLLGYVAVLPLLGGLSDRYGRSRVFLACLSVFVAGSLVTAAAHTLPGVVVGRALQGLGGGGIVPVTLALVADGWLPARRGVALGAVGAVQELGAVLGPVYGAALIAVSSWRLIFWLNIPLALIVGAVFTRRAGLATARRAINSDRVGSALMLLAMTAGVLAIVAPSLLTGDEFLGNAFDPILGFGWVTPIGVAALALTASACAWEVARSGNRQALLPLRHVPSVWRSSDWAGGLLLAGGLGCLVVAFAAADPEKEAIAGGSGITVVGAALIFLVAFIVRERRATNPLVEFTAFRARAAWGALGVNLLVGAALIAALIDIPLFARTTVSTASQVDAALVLVRLLIAVPVGALVGGVLTQRVGPRSVAAAGLLLTAVAFLVMARWDAGVLNDRGGVQAGAFHMRGSDGVLALGGLGFGLAIAPVNAAILTAVSARLHGLASALVVVARSIGMLVGLSVLTALGLRRYYAAQARIPAPTTLCPDHPLHCAAYDARVGAAIVDELHVIFLGAAVCALVAAALAVALLGGRVRRAVGGGVDQAAAS